MGDERLGIGRLCPNCGVRSDTLGTVCPACGAHYEGRGGLLDRIPILGSGTADTPATARLLLWAWIALIIGAIVMLIEHPVAGILILAAAFALLVAAIGAANALNDRGR